MSCNDDQAWYEGGLRFECMQCGRCCRGAGNVWVTDDEIEALARCIDQPVDTFRATHIKRAARRGLVLAQKRNQDCVFWDEKHGCAVYAARPRQCRTYPFWRANLVSEEEWQSEGRSCLGIGEGPLHDRASIDALLDHDGIPDHRSRLRTRKP